MKLSDVMSHSGLTVYAEIALIVFLAAFAAVVIRVLAAKRHDMDRAARLPLDGDDADPKRPNGGPS